MKVAVISDIHANISAFEAVLKDIEGKQVDQVYCTGDLVGYGPFPNEVVELIRNKQISTVLGNYDDAIGFMKFICGCDYQDEKAQALGERSIFWTKTHTSEDNKRFLRSLPREKRFTVEDTKVLLVHGSPKNLTEYLFENTPRDYVAELLSFAETDVLICGHTHKPYHVTLGAKHLINAGSVGKPKHGDPQATYVTIEFGNVVSVEVHKVPYDFEVVANAIEDSELPDEFAEMLREGRG